MHLHCRPNDLQTATALTLFKRYVRGAPRGSYIATACCKHEIGLSGFVTLAGVVWLSTRSIEWVIAKIDANRSLSSKLAPVRILDV